MNILLLGSGGREHALAWKMQQSPLCGELFIAPGNAGTALCGTNVNIALSDFQSIGDYCLDKNVEMLVVGPEQPLVDGIADHFKNDPSLAGIKVIGPSSKGAMLEGSKAFAKAFMMRHNIPTATYFETTRENLSEGLQYIAGHDLPIVLKADGLAAGKGVLICNDRKEAQEELSRMLDGKFGSAGHRVVIESFLSGLEFSVFILTNGRDYQLLPVAKDYKRIGEGDTGLNTGGMGAVSPVFFADEEMMTKVRERIIHPTLDGLQKEGIDYCGFIFFGLIEVNGEPFVIEYNCRMGDPETEVVIPRITSDLVELFADVDTPDFGNKKVHFDVRACTTVMMVSGGYPEAYEKGKTITGIDNMEGSIAFMAGAKSMDGDIITNGGRVIAISSLGENIQTALDASYANASKIDFEGKYYRRDIGRDLLATV